MRVYSAAAVCTNFIYRFATVMDLVSAQLPVESEDTIRVAPVRSLDNQGPIEFCVPAHPTALTDLRESFLSVSLSVKRAGKPIVHRTGLTESNLVDPDSIAAWATPATGSTAGEDANLSCVNNLMHSLFGEVHVYLNEVELERQSDYWLAAFTQVKTGFDREHKESALEYLFGWYDDEAGAYSAKTNSAHAKRQKHLLLNGKTVHFKARLQLGMMSMPAYLPNHTSLKIVMHRKNASLPLIWIDAQVAKPDGDYAIDISHAEFETRRVNLLPSVLADYEREFGPKKLGRFSFTKTECKAFTIPASGNDVTLDNMFTGPMPETVTICLLPNKAYHGHLDTNPFDFGHYDMNFAVLQGNGVLYPAPNGYDRMQLKTSNRFADAYLNLFRIHPHGITRSDFVKGGFMLPFQLHSSGKTGVVTGRFKFDSPLPEAMTLVALATYTVEFVVDSLRNVNYNYIP